MERSTADAKKISPVRSLCLVQSHTIVRQEVGVIVPTALYGAEACGMRSAERRKVNVLEMKCLRSLVGVSRMDRVRNEEVRMRAGIEREL